MTGFKAPCAENYRCEPSKLELYARDEGMVDFLKCNSCGIIWQDTVTVSGTMQYDESYFQKLKYEDKRDHRVKRSHVLLGMLEQHKEPGKLLDIGASLGYSLEAALERGWNAEGIDISKHASEYCADLGIPVYHASLKDWSGTGQTYDAITMRHVLEHFENPFEALSYVNKLLKIGGVVQISVPNSDLTKSQKLREEHKFFNHKKGGIEHLAYFNQETLRDILEYEGFEVVQEDYPILIENQNSKKEIANRLLRRAQSLANLNQEIITIAIKK